MLILITYSTWIIELYDYLFMRHVAHFKDININRIEPFNNRLHFYWSMKTSLAFTAWWWRFDLLENAIKSFDCVLYELVCALMLMLTFTCKVYCDVYNVLRHIYYYIYHSLSFYLARMHKSTVYDLTSLKNRHSIINGPLWRITVNQPLHYLS